MMNSSLVSCHVSIASKHVTDYISVLEVLETIGRNLAEFLSFDSCYGSNLD